MSHTESQLIRVRDRFLPPREPERSRPAIMLRFLSLSAAKARADALPTQSAALGFITVLSLVPLLASLSHFSAGFFADRLDEVVEMSARILPYTAESINQQLRLFLEQSQSLRGFGLLAFLLTALTAFGMIEKTINDIWDVPRRRPLRGQLNSFVLLIAWGPVLIGATYSGLFVLRKQPALERLAETVPVQLIPFTVTLIGLTMLNWQVPYTRVEFRHALVGGATSAVLLEALRATFAVYSQAMPQMSLVYGSFGFALFFMVSIQMSWLIVLFGTELAYCVQNYSAMTRHRRSAERVEGSWLGLAAMAVLIDRVRRHEPVTSHQQMAARLGLETEELRTVLAPLVEARYLQESLGEVDGYLLACDPHEIKAGDLLDLYESQQWDVLAALPESAAKELENLRARLTRARHQTTGEITLADLAPPPPPPEAAQTTEE